MVSLEPSPSVFAELQANLKRNRSRNVRLLQVAASDREEQLVLEQGPASNSGLTATAHASPDALCLRVQARRLADCLSSDELASERLQARGHSASELFDRLIGLGFSASGLANDYDPEAYFAPRLQGPSALHAAPDRELDVIFTRRG